MRRTGEQLVMEGVRWIKSHPADWRALQDACVLIEAATDSQGRRCAAGDWIKANGLPDLAA